MNYITTNQGSITWDAVTTLQDGSPIPANHKIKYTVFLMDPYGIERIVSVTNATNCTFYTVHPDDSSPPDYNTYAAGVKACLYTTNRGWEYDDIAISCAETIWSSITMPEPFVYISSSVPSPITNLQDATI